MPVHWFYDQDILHETYGHVTDFQEPSEKHPFSVLHRFAEDDVVGNVILHNKKEQWRKADMHYHHGLHKGENTLNAQLAREVMRTVIDEGEYDSAKFLQHYIQFMTVPGKHNDTYADSFHRGFFQKLSNNISPHECAGDETPVAGAMVAVSVVALAFYNNLERAKEECIKHVRLTHNSKTLELYVEAYVEVLLAVLHGEDVKSACEKASVKSVGQSLEPIWGNYNQSDSQILQTFGLDCHVSSSFPSVLFLAGKYEAKNLEAAIISNTNVGGSNVHRGALLGTILGAASENGECVPERWVNGLYGLHEIRKEIDSFLSIVMRNQGTRDTSVIDNTQLNESVDRAGSLSSLSNHEKTNMEPLEIKNDVFDTVSQPCLTTKTNVDADMKTTDQMDVEIPVEAINSVCSLSLKLNQKTAECKPSKCPITPELLKDRMKTALWGMFVADALAMPAHWFYNEQAIRQLYGRIVDFQAPHKNHPDSFLHHFGQEPVIGSVILHGKKDLWQTPGIHYHEGLKKGENTLNAQLSRVVMQTVIEHGKYDSADFLENYIEFMVNPGNHNDTYADSFHRDFFSNFAKNVSPFECAGNETPDSPSAGAMVMIAVVAFTFYDDVERAKEECIKHIRLTHKSECLELFVINYVELLLGVLHGKNVTCACEEASMKSCGQSLKCCWSNNLLPDSQAVQNFGLGCHVTSSFPAVLFLAGKYDNNLEAALISNTNIGGSNVHRGSMIGAILGAAQGGDCIPQRWMEGLLDRAEIENEINQFVELVTNSKVSKSEYAKV
eukprot:CFRG6223T1